MKRRRRSSAIDCALELHSASSLRFVKHPARFCYASDQSLLVYFGSEITVHANRCVTNLLRLLEAEPIPGVQNIHPAYCSLLIKFDALKMGHAELEEILLAKLDRAAEIPLVAPRRIEIPVCYDKEFGPDLDDVARMHELTPIQVMELHTSADYLVYFLGFVPGFAYMGGLPEKLATRRLATPRAKVSSGSVGIAEKQTAVYPLPTPGGWRLIGRTPISMFRPDRIEMSLLATGDHVRFVPISREQFSRMESACR